MTRDGAWNFGRFNPLFGLLVAVVAPSLGGCGGTGTFTAPVCGGGTLVGSGGACLP